ncbi:TPA: hypothetical protein ACT9LC_002891 [Legionella pneumophila]|uniref:hypothetical protein n=1 Tax=Legionella pneumophila TaxID=446 RepID=UPI0038B62A19|nr:hypothetical protein [Legionella pneumophila]
MNIVFNKSHMPHPYAKGWGRLKPGSNAPVPDVPLVPVVFDSIVIASVFRDLIC